MLTRAQVRDLDRQAITEYGIPALVLMENAGRGAAELLLALGIHGPVAVCCGKGNNGGDGMVMARHLHNRQIDVAVHLFAQPDHLSQETAQQWHIVTKAHIPVHIWPASADAAVAAELARAEWIVDALFGTGLEGPVRAPLDRIITIVNASPGDVFAVDIPSGLDADTGAPMGATVRARHTATFVASKKGYGNPVARAWLGRVHVIDIGVPLQLLSQTNGVLQKPAHDL
jgi:NAD(P)H-hydrate epimerase